MWPVRPWPLQPLQIFLSISAHASASFLRFLHTSPACFLESAKYFLSGDFCPCIRCPLYWECPSVDMCKAHSLPCLVSQHSITSEMPSAAKLPMHRGLSLSCSSIVFPSWHITILCAFLSGGSSAAVYTGTQKSQVNLRSHLRRADCLVTQGIFLALAPDTGYSLTALHGF